MRWANNIFGGEHRSLLLVQNMIKRVRLLVVLGMLLLLPIWVSAGSLSAAPGDSQAPLKSQVAAAFTGTKATNIIIMIGDGMGKEHVKAARYYLGEPLSFEGLPYQSDMTTYAANNSVTDSAASATSMATGVKVNTGVISLAIPGDSSELETTLEEYKKLGKMTGLVSTAYITHATPAGWGAHETSRSNYSQIADDYLTQTKPDVLMGGAKYVSESAALAAGYTVVDDRVSMQALNTELPGLMLSGRFGSDYMPYEYDGMGSLPHLTEMSETALDVLDNDADGFFLMVEGARIDHAAHSNDLPRTISETIEFGNAAQSIIDWVDDPSNGSDWSNTLLVVTADHETGGLTVTADNGAGNLPTVSWSTSGHTDDDVPVYAKGVDAAQVTGTIDNTNIYDISTATRVTFAAIGDFGGDTADEGYVADMIAGWEPDFVVTTGDNYYNNAGGSDTGKYDESIGKYYCSFLEGITTTGSNCPTGSAADNAFFPTLGNHDYSDAGDSTASNYITYFDLPGIPGNSSGSEYYYDFVQGPVHYFALNSNTQEDDGTSSTSDQAAWLQTQLAASTAPWKIVYFHHAPYSTADTHGDTDYMQWPFDEWGVDVVLNGHDHIYERLEKDGVWYFVTGNSGWNLRTDDCYGQSTGAASYECYDDHYGAMRITATDSRLLLEELSIDDAGSGSNGGKLIDSLTLPENLVPKPETIQFQNGVSPTAAYAGTIDTTISEEEPTTNYGNAAECYVDGDDPQGDYLDKSALLKWDVSELPSDETIHSASITLRITNSSPDSYQLYALKQDWQELQATWQKYDSGNNWQNAGAQGAADRGSTVLGTLAPSSTGFYTIDLNSDGVALVQSWVNGATANQGIIIANGSNDDGLDFYCRNVTTPTDRPQLTIEYGEASLVDWIWSGGVTADSARVNAKLKGASSDVWLAVSETDDFSSPAYFGPATADADNNYTVSIEADGLDPLNKYYYAVYVGDTLDSEMQGEFQTFSTDPFSFTFAFSGDAYQGSNATVYDDVRDENALFFLSPGDFMYADINTNDTDLYRTAFADSLTADRQSQLYRSLPIAYTWDDHDYGPNDSDKDSPSREAARLAYREIVPSYPLDAGSGNAPIYQAFHVGQAYFILTDLRSEKNPDGSTMMGSAQKVWFKDQLQHAKANNYAPIFWVSSVPWIATELGGADHWGGYAAERTEIANFIKDNEIDNVFILAADAHMLALDDGSNSDYATGGGAAMPVFHAAALNQNGSVKGGPYSEGTYPNDDSDVGQYALVTVNVVSDTEIEVTYIGKRQAAAAAGAGERNPNAMTETEVLLGPWSTTINLDVPTAVGQPVLSATTSNNLVFFSIVFVIFSVLLIISLHNISRNKRKTADL